MGKIYQGILGKVSGKVGSVVGSSWKGIPTVRIYNETVANPRTAAQVENRGHFATVTAIGSSLLASIVKPFWDRFALKQSGYNAFVNANMRGLDFESIPTTIVLSKGNLAMPTISPSFVQDAEDIKVTWNPNERQRYDLSTDKLWAVLMNKDTGEFIGAPLYTSNVGGVQATRAAGTGYLKDADIPDTWVPAANKYALAVLAMREDSTQVSLSVGVTNVSYVG